MSNPLRGAALAALTAALLLPAAGASLADDGIDRSRAPKVGGACNPVRDTEYEYTSDGVAVMCVDRKWTPVEDEAEPTPEPSPTDEAEEPAPEPSPSDEAPEPEPSPSAPEATEPDDETTPLPDEDQPTPSDDAPEETCDADAEGKQQDGHTCVCIDGGDEYHWYIGTWVKVSGAWYWSYDGYYWRYLDGTWVRATADQAEKVHADVEAASDAEKSGTAAVDVDPVSDRSGGALPTTGLALGGLVAAASAAAALGAGVLYMTRRRGAAEPDADATE